MSLNIKNERTVALVRELAERTGESQTAAIEDAVVRRLDELGRSHRDAEAAEAQARRVAAGDLLRDFHGLLTEEDKRAIGHREDDLYDDNGLPR